MHQVLTELALKGLASKGWAQREIYAPGKTPMSQRSRCASCSSRDGCNEVIAVHRQGPQSRMLRGHGRVRSRGHRSNGKLHIRPHRLLAYICGAHLLIGWLPWLVSATAAQPINWSAATGHSHHLHWRIQESEIHCLRQYELRPIISN